MSHATLRALTPIALVLCLYAAERSQAQTAPRTPTITVSPNLRMIPGEHNEPWVAVSSNNPDIVIAAAQQGGGTGAAGLRAASTMISRDGGRSWVAVTLPRPSQTPFDVSVASGPNGRLYVMQGTIGGDFAAQLGGQVPARSMIRFWASADGGWTWDGPTELTSAVDQDHMRMTIDMSKGPHRGRVYVAWNDVADRFVRNQYEVFLQWSDDGGKTFTEPTLIDTRKDGKLVATEPVVLSDGTLLVTYYQYFNPLARRENERMPMYVVRSADGGKTFEPPVKVFEFGPHVWRSRIAEFSRAFTLPIVTADTSSRSPYLDRIYITWDDVRGGTSNIWFVRSLDRGKTWTSPMRINDNADAPADGPPDYRMTPVVAVTPTGQVGIAWYDRRNDPNRMCWDYLFALSTDGGAHFGPNERITTAASCPPPNLAPGVAVHNVAPRLRDPNTPPDSIRLQRTMLQELRERIVEENRAATEERFRGVTGPRLSLSFDPARNVWPGHYTGLAADRDGVFHAVWLDRRGGQQELYAARVFTTRPERPATLVEGDVSRQLEVVAGSATFDSSKRAVTVPLQLRNVSDAPVYGPLELRMQGVGSVAGFDTTITFGGKLGTADRLLPRDLSEPVKVTVVVKPSAGFDAAFDFRVTGWTSRKPAAAGG